MQRFNVGDLVRVLDKRSGLNKAVGVIVKVDRRNDQEPRWDMYTVHVNGLMGSYNGRRLKQFVPKVVTSKF